MLLRLFAVILSYRGCELKIHIRDACKSSGIQIFSNEWREIGIVFTCVIVELTGSDNEMEQVATKTFIIMHAVIHGINF